MALTHVGGTQDGVLKMINGKYYAADCVANGGVATTCNGVKDAGESTAEKLQTTYVAIETTHGAIEKDKDPANVYTVVNSSNGITATATVTPTETTYGHTGSHVTMGINLGAMTGTLGYSKIESNDPAIKMDKKITFLGLNGSIGDTGMGWTAYARSVEGHDGKDTDKWGASLGKSLGGNSVAYIDHGNDGENGTTFVGMNVNF